MINRRFISNGVIYTISGASSLKEFFEGLEIKELTVDFPSYNYEDVYKCVVKGKPGLFKYAEFCRWRILRIEVGGHVVRKLDAESCIRKSIEEAEKPLLYLDDLVDKAKSR